MEQKIRAYAKEHLEEAKALLEELGKIPAPSHKEDKRAAFCKEWFQRQGNDRVWIDGAKNVICEVSGRQPEEVIVLMAHMDVVFNDLEELPMHWEGSRLYAPGIGDDTANLVNLMMAYRYLKSLRKTPEYTMLFVANACEEGLGNLDGCKEIFRLYGEKVRCFYSFDGYLAQCTSRAVGSHRYRVTIKVQGGHSYLDFGRKNAIQEMAELIGSLYRIMPPTEEKTTYNVGKIEGGTTVNSIAQEAKILYEFRSESAVCLEKMEVLFLETVEKARKDGVEIEVETLGIRPGNGWTDRSPLARWTKENQDIIRHWFPEELDLGAYSTDANVPLSLGILANTIGTVRGGGAHTREEWVDTESLLTGMGIIMELVSRQLDR